MAPAVPSLPTRTSGHAATLRLLFLMRFTGYSRWDISPTYKSRLFRDLSANHADMYLYENRIRRLCLSDGSHPAT
jgi:hypothetical protein